MIAQYATNPNGFDGSLIKYSIKDREAKHEIINPQTSIVDVANEQFPLKTCPTIIVNAALKQLKIADIDLSKYYVSSK